MPQEAGSFMAPVVFWSGVYNLQDRYLPDNQVINALCVVSGCAVLVWVVIVSPAFFHSGSCVLSLTGFLLLLPSIG